MFFYSDVDLMVKRSQEPMMNTMIASLLGKRKFDTSDCCDMGQNDTIGKIELFPLSSCQVIILIARMTFNCFSSCLMS